MAEALKTVLLLALPASGKSELRRYMASLSPAQVEADLHMGDTVQLDDYPYVHMMRRISAELRTLGEDGIFFDSDDLPMKQPLDWGTLIELVNEDHADLIARPSFEIANAARWLLDRYSRARAAVGAPAPFDGLSDAKRAKLEAAIETDSRQLLDDKVAGIPETLNGKTVVVEFARGGPLGEGFPLPAAFGYLYSLEQLSQGLLEHARILYLWVSPEESRRKNEDRARPDADGSILHHGVPHAVMIHDYGTDDMSWLLEESSKPGCVQIKAHNRSWDIPVARLDNRKDLTSFLREEEGEWAKADVDKLHAALKEAMERLAKA